MGLKVGEKYLSMSIGGKDGIRVALFPNKERRSDNDPKFIGSIPLAIWVNEKKEEPRNDPVDEELIV